jgi:hypothetical protein
VSGNTSDEPDVRKKKKKEEGTKRHNVKLMARFPWFGERIWIRLLLIILVRHAVYCDWIGNAVVLVPFLHCFQAKKKKKTPKENKAKCRLATWSLTAPTTAVWTPCRLRPGRTPPPPPAAAATPS